MIVIHPVQTMKEGASAVLAAVTFTSKLDACESALVGQVHDLLNMLAVAYEVGATADGTGIWLARTPCMNRKRGAICLCRSHDDAR